MTPSAGVTLAGNPAHYIGRVLRLRPGNEVLLFDGTGGEYPATINRITRGAVDLDVGNHLPVERESPLAVTLAVGISRGNRMDFTIQKAVELGLQTLVPLVTDRCGVRLSDERAGDRVRHWRGVALSACEQCGRNRLAVVQPVTNLTAWLSSRASGAGWVLAPHGNASLHELPAPGQSLTLLIGPEGGLSAEEVQRATDAGFHALRLGPRVLRAETAAVAALSAVQTLWGDLG